MYLLFSRILFIMMVLVFSTSLSNAAIMGQIGHFPTTSGSSWIYSGSGLTKNRSGAQVTQSFTEIVTSSGGAFHSEILFSGANTIVSDNNYIQEDALYVGSTRIVIKTFTDTPVGEMITTTTSDNPYVPPQEYFPSELYAGTSVPTLTSLWAVRARIF